MTENDKYREMPDFPGENTTPDLPHELVTNGNESLKVHAHRGHTFITATAAGEKTSVVVDNFEALLRSLAQHTPHLRIVDAVEHAPEAEDVLAKAMVRHQRIPKYDRAHTNRCSGCDHFDGMSDGPNSPNHVAHQVQVGLAALADAGLAVGPAGSGDVVAWMDEDGDFYVTVGDDYRQVYPTTDDFEPRNYTPLYAGRAPEAEADAAKLRETADVLTKALAKSEAEVQRLTAMLESDAAERIVSAEAEVANLRDALDKADAVIKAQKNLALKSAEMRRWYEERNVAWDRHQAKQAEYDAARQALTEVVGGGGESA